MIRTATRTLLVTATVCLGALAPAHAADVADSRDNPQLERFPGSEIAFYKLFNLDEAFFLRAPMDTHGPVNLASDEWLKAEGRVTQIRYTMPANTSSLAAYRDIENKLKAKGFQIVFGCSDMACLATRDRTDLRFLGERMDPHIGNQMMYFDRDRYLLARRDQPDGPVYVSALIGERLEQSVAFVQILEPEQSASPKTGTRMAACPQLFGPWRNIDPKTRSMSRAEITGSCDPGARIVVRIWGACTPKDCDWGNIPAQFDQAEGEITATTKVSFEVTRLVVRLDDAGRLAIRSITHFTDNSKRADTDQMDLMQR
jgi:Domain of unknown function (DUF4892)